MGKNVITIFSIIFFGLYVNASEVMIPAGEYEPFLVDIDGESSKIIISKFEMDDFSVTNYDYLKFVRENEKWQKNRIKSSFADKNYLAHWQNNILTDLEIKNIGDKPVVNVSWFAARAYCKSHGKDLPTMAQWEYSAFANDQRNVDRILSWYATSSNELKEKRQFSPNKFGLYGMNGNIWEWIFDYNSIIVTNDSRNSRESDKGFNSLFCGSGSLTSKNPTNYAAFMRYAFRSALESSYTSAILGFRCAKYQEYEL